MKVGLHDAKVGLQDVKVGLQDAYLTDADGYLMMEDDNLTDGGDGTAPPRPSPLPRFASNDREGECPPCGGWVVGCWVWWTGWTGWTGCSGRTLAVAALDEAASRLKAGMTARGDGPQ